MSSADALLNSDRATEISHDSRKKRQRRTAESSGSFLCAPLPAAQPFVAVSWAPLALTPSRGSLLCAAVGHACAVYARPVAPMQLKLDAVVQLTPLLHAALGHSATPSEAERAAATVHGSDWSRLVEWHEPSAAGSSAVPSAAARSTVDGACCYLALAGPRVLAVVAHTPEDTAEGSTAQPWHVALSLRAPANSTVVRFVAAEEAVEAAETAGSPRVSALVLISGASDGSVVAWRLTRTWAAATSSSAAAGTAAGARLVCTAARRVGSTLTTTRRISSLSTARIAEGTASGVCMLLVGSGPFVMLHRLDDLYGDLRGSAAEAAVVKSDAAADESARAATAAVADTDSPPASLRLPAIGYLVHQAAHASEVSRALSHESLCWPRAHALLALLPFREPLLAPCSRLARPPALACPLAQPLALLPPPPPHPLDCR